MKYPRLRRTWLWPIRNRRSEGRSAGSMTLMTVFLFFLISSIGLGLAYLARVYQKLGAHKIRAFRMSCAAENGAKQAFDALCRAIQSRSFPEPAEAERLAGLKAETAAGSLVLAEEVLGLSLPFAVADAEGPQSWRSRFNLGLGFFRDYGDYFLADFQGVVLSEGQVEGYDPRKSASLDVELKILAGCIPLAYFPLLVAGPDGPAGLNEPLSQNRIEVLPTSQRRTVPGPSSTTAALIPDDATPFLEKALKIKIFSPDKLTRAQLRSALGLPMVNEPVPDGVYLINNDSGLGGVFVQGDVEEMILAVQAGFQVIQFGLEEGIWRLRFNPSAFETEFQAPDRVLRFNLSPLPIVLVNGKVASLGGGAVNPDGTLSITQDPTIPSVLDGVSLSIICSDEVTLTSHLIQEGVRWSDGIPYLKDSRSQLVIHAGGRDFVEGTEKSGKIKVGRDAPRDLQIHASMSARGGFSVPEGSKELLLAGGLQTSSLDLGTSRLRIVPDERIYFGSGGTAESPRSAAPLLTVLSLEPRQWRE